MKRKISDEEKARAVWPKSIVKSLVSLIHEGLELDEIQDLDDFQNYSKQQLKSKIQLLKKNGELGNPVPGELGANQQKF